MHVNRTCAGGNTDSVTFPLITVFWSRYLQKLTDTISRQHNGIMDSWKRITFTVLRWDSEKGRDEILRLCVYLYPRPVVHGSIGVDKVTLM